MGTGWQVFRILAVLQFIGGTVFACLLLFINISFYSFLVALAYASIAWFSLLAISLVNNNYPDKAVEGSQKTLFNWLYILNVLALVVLFSALFLSIKTWRYTNGGFGFTLVISIGMLLLQLALLYGMFLLRRLLYQNAKANMFEFERPQ